MPSFLPVSLHGSSDQKTKDPADGASHASLDSFYYRRQKGLLKEGCVCVCVCVSVTQVNAFAVLQTTQNLCGLNSHSSSFLMICGLAG